MNNGDEMTVVTLPLKAVALSSLLLRVTAWSCNLSAHGSQAHAAC
jgi:hypothetical protein